jgi:hypothetical protein
MTHKSNQTQISKKDWEKLQDEIHDPEEDYFDVRKHEYSKYSYKPRYNKENPY